MGVADLVASWRDADDAIAWRDGAPLPDRRARTLPDLFAACLAEHGDAPVLEIDGQRWSWRALDAAAARLAYAWRDLLPPGERVAIVLPNGLAHLLSELAAWRLGAVAAPIFIGFSESTLRAHLAHLDPALVVSDDGGALLPPRARAYAAQDVLRAARSGPGCDARPVSPQTPCLILGTSGTSGAPRGVMLGHDNLCSQQAAFALLWPEVGAGDRLAAYLPWHHSFGALAERLWSLCRGALLTVVPGGGRDADAFAATVRAVRPTIFMSVPKLHRLATERALFASEDLRWAFTAGAPLAEDVRRWYHERGIPVHEGWGLTETSPSATITRLSSRAPGVVGDPIPGVAVGVRACDGHVLVRGPNVMAGYFHDPVATAACLRDGVIDSGDLGEWTVDGLRLLGRADQHMKLPNGEKIAAVVIEARLAAHPAVAHALVAAEPGLVALIEPRPGHDRVGLLAAVAAANRIADLPYQRLSRVVMINRPLKVEDGSLTASLKVARGRVLADYRAWVREGGSAFTALLG